MTRKISSATIWAVVETTPVEYLMATGTVAILRATRLDACSNLNISIPPSAFSSSFWRVSSSFAVIAKPVLTRLIDLISSFEQFRLSATALCAPQSDSDLHSESLSKRTKRRLSTVEVTFCFGFGGEAALVVVGPGLFSKPFLATVAQEVFEA